MKLPGPSELAKGALAEKLVLVPPLAVPDSLPVLVHWPVLVEKVESVE